MNVQKVTPLTPPNLDSSGVSEVEMATYRNKVGGWLLERFILWSKDWLTYTFCVYLHLGNVEHP